MTELADLIPRLYKPQVYEDSQGRIWLSEESVPDRLLPLEEDDLVNISGILYSVVVYAPARLEYLLRPFDAEITEDEWPTLEEEPCQG